MGVYGFYGANDIAIAQFFIERGYDVEIYYADFTDNAKRVNIMHYINSSTGHFATIEKRIDNNFYGYNVTTDNDEVESIGSGIDTYPIGDNEELQAHIMLSISNPAE